ncbi:hypothetical protein RJP21_04540 [Paenibacillus sp. VCA1]|nr:hypothetical protein [Paenibacillus sp. VCA1]MDR9852871.1 hypothetical protein [Paenibacillus sp. VCA1]
MDGVQTEMLQRMTRVETKVDNMDEKLDRAIAANETAVEAYPLRNRRITGSTKSKTIKNGYGVHLPGLFFWQSHGFIISGGLK